MENYFDAVTQRSDTVEKKISIEIGTVIGDGYIVMSLLKECLWGNMYIASKGEQEYVIKIFGADINRDDINILLSTINSTSIVTVLDYGTINGLYYEVYSYIAHSTFLGERIQDIDILIEIVSQIIEALKILHDVGITHGDIKPSNIFWDKESNKIFLSDFDSATISSDGYLVHEGLGTLEYSAPCESSLYKAKKNPAFDYGSLGVMLLDLYNGYVYFAGKSEMEILSEWEKGIKLPEQMPIRLRQLLKGLLVANEEKRYSYSEVKRWCGNEIVNNKQTVSVKKQQTKSMVFGYEGSISIKVNDLEELSICLKQYKQLAKQRFFDSANKLERLIDYVRFFDVEKANEIRKIVKENDIDSAIFMTANLLHKSETLVFQDKYYNDLAELMDDLSFDSVNREFVSFVKNGSMNYYLEETGKGQVADIVRGLIEEAKDDDDYLYYMLKFRFSSNCEVLEINEMKIHTIEELCTFVAKDQFKSFDVQGNYAKVCAWLYKIGYSEQVLKMKEAVRKNE